MSIAFHRAITHVSTCKIDQVMKKENVVALLLYGDVAWQCNVKGWLTTSLSNHFILKSSKHNYIFIILFHTAVIHKVH